MIEISSLFTLGTQCMNGCNMVKYLPVVYNEIVLIILFSVMIFKVVKTAASVLRSLLKDRHLETLVELN